MSKVGDKRTAAAAARSRAAPAAKRGRTAASGGEGAKSTSLRTRACALVQVGDGDYCSFRDARLMAMDATALLKALAKDPMFSGKLAKHDLNDCCVSVGSTKSDEEPSAREASAATPLKGITTVGAHAAGRGVAAMTNLFIRVGLGLPSTAIAASHALVSLPATHTLSKFAAAVAAAAVPAGGAGRAAAAVAHGESSIRLPEGVSWPYLKSNVLYMRYFYKPLWESVLRRGRVRTDGVDGCIILGTPGIAKSAFGLYALFRALMDGRTVVYDSAKAGFAVFKGGMAYTTPTAEIGINVGALPELADAATLYISDGKAPAPSAAAFTLLISSPKRKIWSKFSQTPGHPQLVLPPMKQREIFELRHVAFPSLDKADVALLFEKWGGSARNVLTFGSDLAWQAQLEEAPCKQPLEALQQALAGASSFDSAASGESIHRVLSLIPRGALKGSTLKPSQQEYYVFDHAELSSQYVAGLFVASLMQKNEQKLTHFLHALKTDSEAAPFYGKLYERTVVTARLRHGGGKLTLKQLPGAATDAAAPATDAAASARVPLLSGGSLNLGSGLPLVRFATAADLKVKWASHRGDAVFMPLSPRFHVIDFVMRLNNRPLLLSSMVSDSHEINIANASFSAVLHAVGLRDSNSEISFMWVLPEEPYRRFIASGPIVPARVSARGNALARRLMQYKLLLKVPTAVAPL